jgi:hypothetical protein
MARYDVRVDGRRKQIVKTDDELREWLRAYRDQHRETDPDAAHVQLIELGRFSWLVGGKLVPRERFLS